MELTGKKCRFTLMDRRFLRDMRLIESLAKYNKPYQYIINNFTKRVNRNNLSANNKKNYNTILKGLNAIKAELKKENNALNKLREAHRMRVKNRRATKVQAHVRGFLERKRQNNARFVPIVSPNGKISMAVRNTPTRGFRAIAAKQTAKKRNFERMFQAYENPN